MSWDVFWYDEQETIILIRPDLDWTWNDFKERMVAIQAMIRSKDYTVDVIYDLSGPFKLPNPNLLPYARSTFAATPPNHGVSVLVQAGGFIRTVLSVMTKVMGRAEKFQYANTVDDAVDMINGLREIRQKRRDTLNMRD